MEQFTIDENRMKDVEYNFLRIQEDINETSVKFGRKETDVRLMAVTKTVESPYINKVIELGADLIGENRVQEFLGKRDELNLNNVEKHLIGHLQTNKVRQIVGEVDMIESLTSLKLAKEISKVSEKKGVVTKTLVEVNIGKEDSKSGVFIEKLEDFIFEVSKLKSIEICGLMTIPPICDTKNEIRKYFEQMKKKFDSISSMNTDNVNMKILSMGMSGDYEEAIAEGSNIVRVGSAIFGARKYI